jgi:hypothetical protein
MERIEYINKIKGETVIINKYIFIIIKLINGYIQY